MSKCRQMCFTQNYMWNVEFRAGRVGSAIKASGNRTDIESHLLKTWITWSQTRSIACIYVSALTTFSVAVDYRGELRGAFMASNILLVRLKLQTLADVKIGRLIRPLWALKHTAVFSISCAVDSMAGVNACCFKFKTHTHRAQLSLETHTLIQSRLNTHTHSEKWHTHTHCIHETRCRLDWEKSHEFGFICAICHAPVSHFGNICSS